MAMKKQITMQELKSLIKEEAQKLNRRTLLEGEKKKLMEELGMMELDNHNYPMGADSDPKGPEYEDKPFSSYLVSKKIIEAGPEDDAGDFAGGKVYIYEIPKQSIFSRDTEDEMWDMLNDMFGTGENGGPGQKYTRISYKIEDYDNRWYVKMVEKEAYDI